MTLITEQMNKHFIHYDIIAQKNTKKIDHVTYATMSICE